MNPRTLFHALELYNGLAHSFAISLHAYHPYNFTALICHHIVCGSATWIVFQPRALRISATTGIPMFVTTISHLVYLTNLIRQSIEPLCWLSASICPADRYCRRKIDAMTFIIFLHDCSVPFISVGGDDGNRTRVLQSALWL